MQLLSLRTQKEKVVSLDIRVSHTAVTIGLPGAKMVHFQDASAEHPAVMSTIGLVHVGFAFAADASGAVMFRLQCLQLREERTDLAIFSANNPRVGDPPRLSEYSPHHTQQTKRQKDVE